MGSILSPGSGAARGLQGDGKAVKEAAHEGVGLGKDAGGKCKVSYASGVRGISKTLPQFLTGC